MPAGAAAQEAQAFDCVIRPSEVVEVGSPVPGILAEVRVGRGDRVAAGDVLARLDARLEEAAVALDALRATDRSGLAAQEARVALAEARMVRAQELFERGAMSREDYDERRANLDVNRADLDRIMVERELARLDLARSRAALSLRRIESPAAGLIMRRGLSAGEYVHQEASIVTLARLDPLHVEVFLPSGLYPRLAEGMAAEVRPAPPIGGAYAAEVTVIDRVFDATSNTVGVRLALPNPDGALPAGQRCTVAFELLGD
ncbi:MAG: efflux RND transporter periplasmic adaptor subunit [Pseudomonadota bacterium]